MSDDATGNRSANVPDDTIRVRDDEEEPPGRDRPSIEPGEPSLENAAFVLLGVLLSLFVIYRIATIFGG